MKQLWKNCLGLFWECGYKISACNTSTISYRPRGILEAVKESTQHGCNIRFEWFFINFSSNFGAKLRNAMASSLSHSMIVSS